MCLGEACALQLESCPVRDAFYLENLERTLRFKVRKCHRLRHSVQAWLNHKVNTLGRGGDWLQSTYDVLLLFRIDLHTICYFLHSRLPGS